MKIIVVVLLTIGFVTSCKDYQLDYYWREYFGTVPKDSALVGSDTQGEIYVGIGYYRNYGLLPARIIPGSNVVQVPFNNVIKNSTFNKILCGPRDNFYWMKANATHLYLQVANKYPVVAGHDDPNNDYFYVGKITVGGRAIIGEIAHFWPGNALLWYIENSQEKYTDKYDILMYDNNSGSCDCCA